MFLLLLPFAVMQCYYILVIVYSELPFLSHNISLYLNIHVSASFSVEMCNRTRLILNHN